MNTVLRFPGGRDRALTLSYDDGVRTDKRLMGILDSFGLKCTFNINSGVFAPEGTVYPDGTQQCRLSRSEAKMLYSGSGHEVAVHFYTHPLPSALPQDTLVYEIMRDRYELEQLFGVPARGCAYPYGDCDAKTKEAMRVCGMAYGRTTRDTYSFELPGDRYSLDPTCHHGSNRLFDLCADFKGMTVNPYYQPKLFYVWGHSYEFDTDGNWDRIERFAEEMGGIGEIWYATNIEIFDYVQAYGRLQFFLGGNAVYNPTVTDIWLSCDGRSVYVPSGQTVRLD